MANGMMPRSAAIAIGDMLDNCARMESGQRVLILAHVDGLHGGDNLVEPEVMEWIMAAVSARNAHPNILWIDEPFEPYVFKTPDIVKAAFAGADVVINNSFDLTIEEVRDLREVLMTQHVPMIRNFATTRALISSTYAQTPYELVSQIRYQVGAQFAENEAYTITDPNGTHLEGRIGAPMAQMPWTQWRSERGSRPWPEWVHPPVAIEDSEGELVFDRSLSWWTRYVGLPPFFAQPVRVSVKNGVLTRFEGGPEADSLNSFFSWLTNRFGTDAGKLSMVHSGVHPNAVPPDQVVERPYRRIIEHQHTSNIHFHLGDIMGNPDWPASMLHLTADIRQPTWEVGEQLIHDDGHLTALEHPDVAAVAAKYPGRPGLPSDSWPTD